MVFTVQPVLVFIYLLHWVNLIPALAFVYSHICYTGLTWSQLWHILQCYLRLFTYLLHWANLIPALAYLTMVSDAICIGTTTYIFETLSEAILGPTSQRWPTLTCNDVILVICIRLTLHSPYIFEFDYVCSTTCELDYSGLHESCLLDPEVLGYFGYSGALVQVL